MYFSSAEELARHNGLMDERDAALTGAQWRPGLGEFVGASLAQAFDRTSGVRFFESGDIMRQEAEERESGTLRTFANEEDFKNSEHYREGMKFEPGMTDVRARIYAENYDQRRRWERIIQAGDENGPWWYSVAGFGAGVIGSLPDPINLVPFGGGAVTGARLAGMTTRQLLARSARVGMVEGAAGNFVSSGYAAWDLNRKGEDMGAQDVLVDTLFGAIAGPVFHGGGALLSRAAARSKMTNSMDLLNSFLPEDSPVFEANAQTLNAMRQGDAGAFVEASGLLTTLEERGIIDGLRRATGPEDRLELSRALEVALMDLSEGRPVDVSPVLEGSGTIGRAQVNALVAALERGEFTDLNFGKLRPDLKTALNEIRTAEGVPLIEGDDLILPANVVKKLYEERMLKNKYSADEVAEVLLNAFHRDADFAASTKYPQNQAVVSLRRKLADFGLISVNETTGETVIKGGFKTEKDSLARKLSRKNVPEGRGIPHTVDGEASPPLAAPRLSALQDEINIRHEGSDVNALEKGGGNSPPDGDGDGSLPGMRRVARVDEITALPDWRTERPDTPPPLEPASLADEGGLGPEEAQVRAMMEEGRLNGEDMERMSALNDEAARLDSLEEAALSVTECVMRVTKP